MRSLTNQQPQLNFRFDQRRASCCLVFILPALRATFLPSHRAFSKSLCSFHRRQSSDVSRTFRPLLEIYIVFSAICWGHMYRQAITCTSRESSTAFYFLTLQCSGSCSAAWSEPHLVEENLLTPNGFLASSPRKLWLRIEVQLGVVCRRMGWSRKACNYV